MLGQCKEINYDNIPRVIYSRPEAAWVGMNEESAKAVLGEDLTVLKRDMNYSSRYVIQADGIRGMIKILMSKSENVLLGCQIIGNGASELINLFAMALENHMTMAAINQTAWAHPSIAEIIHYL